MEQLHKEILELLKQLPELQVIPLWRDEVSAKFYGRGVLIGPKQQRDISPAKIDALKVKLERLSSLIKQLPR